MTELQTVVLAFVRGNATLADLEAAGVGVTELDGGLEVRTPNNEAITAGARDVAEGFLKLAHDPVQLCRWASVLLGASGVLELGLEELPYGSALLEGLWDAIDGGEVRSSAMLAAKELIA